MKFDVTIFPEDLNHSAAIAKQVEDYGFDGLWTAEVAHNPFLPLALGASATKHITLGTQIAVAFPRSPMVMAQMAWDLTAQSNGRFILGLGTQVKAHIERRFSTEWGEPVSRLQEYIAAMRAIWHTWQTGAPLRYKSKYYTFTLMTPFFNPGPIENPNIPVYIAGVNEKMCQMAGETCQGLHAHGFHTRRYLQEIVLSNITQGLQRAGDRPRAEFELVVPAFVVTGRNDQEMNENAAETKSRIAFYASTPTYKPVLDLHNWGHVGDRLSRMAREGKWDTMWKEISDEMLDEVAIVARPDDIPGRIRERYAGIADRICFGWESDDAGSRALWQKVAKALSA